MSTQQPSDNLLDLINQHYTGTYLTTGNISWFVQDAKDDRSLTITELVMNHITGECVGTTSTFDRVIAALKAVSNLKNISPEESQELKEAISLAQPFRAEKEGVKERDAVLTKRADNIPYIQSLDTTKQKVLAFLILTTGVKTGCLLRDEYKLTKVSEGVISVGQRLNTSQTKSRLVKFDPSYINDVLDPEGEHVEILSNTVFSADDAGLVALSDLSPILNGTPLDVHQLRACYCLQRSLEDGATWQQIAEEVGVSDWKGLRNRMFRYAKANGLA
jgi:hypothetical protein